MGLSKHVFVVHGLVELGFGLLNLATSDHFLLPGDTAPPAKSLALLGGNLWSYSIICLGFASLAASTTSDSEISKQFLGVAGLLYNLFIVGAAGSRAMKGWIFIGNKTGISWHLMAIAIHGTISVWFLIWIIQTVTASKDENTDEDKQKEPQVTYKKK